MIIKLNKIIIFILAILMFYQILAFNNVILIKTAEAKYASIIIDAKTGEILSSQNADIKRHPASLTKIMTLYMVFDALNQGKIKLSDQMLVSKRASQMPRSKLWLKPNSHINVKDAILALVTRSANDAAVVVAEHLAKNEKKFAALMSRQARKIGMKNTNFMNASGLRNRKQLSTARDMALLGHRIRQDFPKYYKYFSVKKFKYNGQNHSNHNGLLGRYEGTDGIKTGYIAASGFNLVASVERNERRLIGVVFGGKSGHSRDKHMMKLLDRAYRSIEIKAVRPPDRFKVEHLPLAIAGLNNTDNPFKDNIEIIANIKEYENSIDSASLDNWAIQVGAFSYWINAKNAARDAAKKLGIVMDAKVIISSISKNNNQLYRARLGGFTEKSARRSCYFLQKNGDKCVPIILNNKRLALASQ